MTFNRREEILAALKKIEAMKESPEAPYGNFFAHLSIMFTVTYMGNIPAEYAVEGYVCTDKVEDLQAHVRDAYSELANTETVFTVLNMEEGNDGNREQFDSEQEDYEEGSEQGLD